jgi:UPF0755 protein
MNSIQIGKPKRSKAPKRIFFFIFSLFLIVGISLGYLLHRNVFKPNIDLHNLDYIIIYIPTGSDYADVKEILTKEDILVNPASFEWVAKRKGYIDNVKAGRYKITDRMNNNKLINMLRAGHQLPVQVTFNNIRKLDKLAAVVSAKLELDSADLMKLFTNEEYIKTHFEMTKEEFPAIFLPNTYEVYWNISDTAFVERMYDEYQKFWNSERLEKAEEIGLSPIQITTIASIIQEETNQADELPIMAGVYINRINKDMLLQACPTIRYALNDFSITRVLNRHTEINSPYNTYKNKGLPPGPICLANPQSIDAVLNYEKHDYLFFCAKDDFSGYHVFSKTNAEHERAAAKYKQAYVIWEREKKAKENNTSN